MVELSASLSIAGLMLDIIGVILIFRFALPVGMDVEDRAAKIDYSQNPPKVVWASDYRRRAWVGLGLLVFGFFLQAMGSAALFWK